LPLKKILFCIIILLTFSSVSFAQQGVKGIVVDLKNQPVGFVTIYNKVHKKSTNSNADGTFELTLPQGEHEVFFQSVGYKTQVVVVNVAGGYSQATIHMQDQSYALKEVNVSANGTNPAVWIMRKAISAAPYYKRQVLTYDAKVYVKGSGKLDEIPFLFEKMLKKEGITEGFTFLMESINELSFKQPNTYKEKALSVKNSMSGVDGAPEPMQMVRGSMYNTSSEGVISPLSPQAFSVYDFKLEGSYFEDGREVNRIKVTPKRKGKDVWKGHIYIMEGLWCIHSSDLTVNSSGFENRIITSFRPVAGYDYVWMPVTYDINVKGGFMGFKGGFRYLASVNNYKIKLNPNLDHKWVQMKAREQPQVIPSVEETVAAKKTATPEKPRSKREEKRKEDIEKLLAKDQLTKMEMLKLASKMKQEVEGEELNKLEIVNEDSSVMIVDSLAGKRDSSYWLENRPVPLMASEVTTYIKGDSIIAKLKADSASDSKHVRDTSRHGGGFDFFSILFGTTKTFNKGKHFAKWSGIGQGGEVFLNTVDGFGAAVQWQLGNNRKDGKEWLFTNRIRVPFERPAVNSFARMEYHYKPLKKGWISGEGGTYVSDFNPATGMSAFVNNVMLIFDKRNLLKLYQQDYAKINHRIEITNGLVWGIDAGWYNRYQLWNIERYAKKESIGGKITPNEPVASYTMPTHQATILHTGFSYTPRQRYRIYEGRKTYVQGKLPTFMLNYTYGVPDLLGSDVDYSKMDVSVIERVKPWHWLSLNAKLTHGFFLHNNSSYFPDYVHFKGNRSPIFNGDPLYTFRQLDYYAYSTTNAYTTLHAEFDFKRILVKRLPIINMTNIREVFFYNGLLVDKMPTYQELGYGVDNIYAFIRADVFVGLKDNEYNNWGVRVILNLKIFEEGGVVIGTQ
jgi:hypothetical protein